jgi:site-specific DNA-methyltransferase (cytosine-N4-specific)
MRLWLEKAGVFISGWRVNAARFQQLLGMSMADLDTLAGFSPAQRAYLKTLANMGGSGPYLSNEVEKLAHTTYGIRFNEKNLPKEVLYPLKQAGYIALQRGTAPGGRGAKPFLVTPTAKLDADIVKPLIAQLEEQVRSELRPFLRRPLSEIIAEINAPDRYRRGLALEALAIRLMRLVDLTYVSTRLRGEATGGAEVDVIFETTRLVFSRWQIQCKNTASVSLDDVAKEVGLTHFLKSNVIVIISTGTIGPEARRYSNKIMSDSNLSIILIDREDIGQIVANPTRITEILSREAEHAMKIKALEI